MQERKMMESHPLVFDTLKYAKKLKAVGVSEEQAEVQAETLLEIVTDNLATKKDLEEAKGSLTTTIESVRSDLTKEIELVRSDLTKEIQLVRSDLTKEIELVRSDLTKDIELVRSELKKDIESIRTELKKDMLELELRLQSTIHKSMFVTISTLSIIIGVFGFMIKFVK